MATPQTLETAAQAAENLGQRVRIAGRVQREKVGDVVLRGDLDVLLPDFRFPDHLVGETVTVVGILGMISMPEATVNERGEISQGVAPGTPPRYVLRDAVVVSSPG